MQTRLTELEKELDGDSMRSQMVVSLNSQSRISEGTDAELYLDSSKMHLFDPESGQNLTLAS